MPQAVDSDLELPSHLTHCWETMLGDYIIEPIAHFEINSREEVVGIWSWNDLRNERKWFEDIIMPNVKSHREGREQHRITDNDAPVEEDDVEMTLRVM